MPALLLKRFSSFPIAYSLVMIIFLIAKLLKNIHKEGKNTTEK